MNKVEVTMDLTREKAIDMITKRDSVATMSLSIDVSHFESRDELESTLENMDWDFDSFKGECLQKFSEMKNEKLELSKLHTHEIYEKGESLGFWKQTEKQKRLV